jgi:nickel-dependent lactate racemase
VLMGVAQEVVNPAKAPLVISNSGFEEAQILARILSRNRVIMVGPKCDGGMLEAMGLMHVATAEEAMRTAFSLVGEDGRVAVLPDGVSLIVEGVSR